MTVAIYAEPADVVRFTALEALSSGDIVELPDGRLGVVQGLEPLTAGDLGTAAIAGHFRIEKTASVVMLAGQEAYYLPATEKISYAQANGIPCGIVLEDAAASASTVLVDLNAVKRYAIDSRMPFWTTTAVNQTAAYTLLPGGAVQLAIDNGNEAGKAAMLSVATIDVDDSPVLEGRVAIYDASDNTVDINFGLASGDHATDFETIAAFAALQVDGGSLSINAHSDDGTTDVAPVDTTVDYVDDTYFHFMIDARDKTSVKLYVNGARVLSESTFSLSAYSSALAAIAHVEKTTGTATADIRIDFLRAWAQR